GCRRRGVWLSPVESGRRRGARGHAVPAARHFFTRHAAEAGRRLALSADAERVLAAHSWPGNVRELENAVERAVVLARSDTIEPEDLLLQERPAALPAAGTLHGTLHRPAP